MDKKNDLLNLLQEIKVVSHCSLINNYLIFWLTGG